MRPLRQYPFLMVADGANWQRVDPALLSALNTLGRTRGQLLDITSGYRSREEQARLYERYKASGFNIKFIAAKPGESNHETGRAVDVTLNGRPLALAVSRQELAAYGLASPVKGDPVHTELAGSSQAPATGDTTAPPVGPAAPAGDATAAPVSAQGPALGTPPAAADPVAEMPGTAQHYLPGEGGVAESWQTIAALPGLAPDTQRLIQLSSGG